MTMEELARRLCVADPVHDAKRATGPAPCSFCIVKARNWWGLATDPKMKADFDVLVQFRMDELGPTTSRLRA